MFFLINQTTGELVSEVTAKIQIYPTQRIHKGSTKDLQRIYKGSRYP
jgi:hypothetical protein